MNALFVNSKLNIAFFTLALFLFIPSSVLAVEVVKTGDSVAPEYTDGEVGGNYIDPYVGGPNAPTLEMATILAEDGWQNNDTVKFTWDLPANITAVAANIASTSGSEPSKAYRPPVGELKFDLTDYEDGVYYFAVQFRNEDKWGYVAERQIKIDRVPPESFSIEANFNEDQEKLLLNFQTTDKLSGISHYRLLVNGGQPVVITREQAIHNTESVDILDGGEYNITVEAYDKAGNKEVSEISVFAPKTTLVGNWTMNDLLSSTPLLVGFLSLILLLTISHLISVRVRYAKDVKQVRRETKEVQIQLIKIFNALREEIHDQIDSINSKKKLSKNEKEAIEGLNKALKVSESLLEKEVEDVIEVLDK